MMVTDEKILKETINSIINMGGVFIKQSKKDICFTINKESELGTDIKKLRSVRDFLSQDYDLTLKVKYV